MKVNLRPLAFVMAITITLSVNAVDKNKFRMCQQSSFCRRCRGMEPGQTIYSLDLSTLQVNPNVAEVLLNFNEDRFRVEISALKSGGFRVKIREAFPLHPRFEVLEVLDGEPEVKEFAINDFFEVFFFKRKTLYLYFPSSLKHFHWKNLTTKDLLWYPENIELKLPNHRFVWISIQTTS